MTFEFVMDAFPDYTKFNTTKKVFADIQIINEANTADDGSKLVRKDTLHPVEDQKKF